MSTNLELEIKSMRTKDDYEKLITLLGADKIYEQVNYYIDTKNRLLVSKNCGLRIRTKGDEIELTLKVPQGEGKLEINQQISNKQLKLMESKNIFPEGEIKHYIANVLGVKIDSLYILGKLITKRLDLPFKTSLLSIDESFYNGIYDYEIESEDNSIKHAKDNLLEFLKNNGIEFNQSQHNKINRFLNSL